MFSEIREKVSLLEAVQHYSGQEVCEAGTNTYQLMDKDCPFCGHNDCFKIRVSDEATNFKCFSCDEWGSDAVSFYSVLKGVDQYTAARQVAKDFKVPIESNISTHQKIFELAAQYFHACLFESKDEIVAKDVQYTPYEYQTKYRKHLDSTLQRAMVGWNNGEILRYLRTFDFSDEELLETGLVVRDKKYGKVVPFLKKGCFVYPHFVKGLVSHFTQKDPYGETKYQLRNENSLNRHVIYGQDTAFKSKRIIIVEGENDRLSIEDYAPETFGVLATNGTPSGPQRKWIEVNFSDKEIITIFDRDDAGDKYRNMFWKMGLPNLKQYVAPEPFKDVDELLKKSEDGTLEDLVEVPDPASVPVEGADVVEGVNVFELDGCYCKVKINGTTGERHVIKISNFIIKMRNVFVKGDGERSREVVVVRKDGAVSNPFLVTSEVKVSLRSFKEAVADAVDASFYGDEKDLLEMWDFIYSKGSERLVKIPKEVGRIADMGGWLFGDCFITPTGAVVGPDKEGVMWVNGNSGGIKPASINLKNKSKVVSLDIPRLGVSLNEAERREFTNGFIRQFVTNIGDVGAAMTMISWCNANAYSDYIFDKYGFFPFLFLWGRHSKGKTTITRWLLALYGMDNCGSSTVPQLKSGVGFSRMLGYFSSLPMLLDEVRADRECMEFYGHFRAWYNRQGRSMGSKETDSIITQEVKANIIFCGQDVFTDTATRSRCLEVQVPTHGRELEKSYMWVESGFENLKAIGYQWILDAAQCNVHEMFKEMQETEKKIMEGAGCDNRSAKHWSMVHYFSVRLLEQAGIGFDMMSYVIRVCKKGYEEQQVDDLVLRFFSSVEGLQVAERTEISGSHIKAESDKVHLWLPELVKMIRKAGMDGERFSRNAIMAALRDEPYFVDETRPQMGPEGVRRRCYTFRLDDDVPESLKNIALVASKRS